MRYFNDPIDSITPKTSEETEAMRKVVLLRAARSARANELAEVCRLLVTAAEESAIGLSGADARRKELIAWISRRSDEITRFNEELSRGRSALEDLVRHRAARPDGQPSREAPREP